MQKDERNLEQGAESEQLAILREMNENIKCIRRFTEMMHIVVLAGIFLCTVFAIVALFRSCG